MVKCPLREKREIISYKRKKGCDRSWFSPGARTFLWADWKTKFWEVVNFHAPLRTRRARIKKTPWINLELKKGMRDRDTAQRKDMTMTSEWSTRLGKV